MEYEMTNAILNVPVPVNEPVKPYKPGCPERAEIKHVLNAMY